MPSKSESQRRMMAAAAHNPKFAKKVGVPQNVAQDFNQADAGSSKKFPQKKKSSSSLKRGSEHWK